MSHLKSFLIVCIFNQFDLSGNTGSGFQKLAKIDNLWHFWLTFVNVARFARDVDDKFFCGFQTLW